MNEKSRPCKAADLIENSSHSSGPDPIYEARLAGWLEGYHKRDREIERLGLIADRLYTEMCRRPGKPFIDPNRPSYAQLEQTRADIYAGNK